MLSLPTIGHDCCDKEDEKLETITGDEHMARRCIPVSHIIQSWQTKGDDDKESELGKWVGGPTMIRSLHNCSKQGDGDVGSFGFTAV